MPTNTRGRLPRVKSCRGSLARAEFGVAWFYQKSRKAYRAAIPRYENILKNYPDFGGVEPPRTDADRWNTRPFGGR